MTEPARRAEPLFGGFELPEGLRWRDGSLWFADMTGGRVLRTDLTSPPRVVLEVDDDVGGIGWLPTGDLLVVSMHERRVLRVGEGPVRVHADLRPFVGVAANDMVVDGAGRAYVGQFGYDRSAGEDPRPTEVLSVDVRGHVAVAASGLTFPNGMALSPPEDLLLVAETFASRITSFAVAADGTLSAGRAFAEVPAPERPDAIALDREGAVWMASPATGRALRVAEGGEVIDVVETGRPSCYGCALGGDDRRTLLLGVADRPGERRRGRPRGEVVAVRVDVPGV